jgi:hypothetical protein
MAQNMSPAHERGMMMVHAEHHANGVTLSDIHNL